jgi:catechol 2,3-dioxygenase-like lactoylglutathione lyase family enzyme
MSEPFDIVNVRYMVTDVQEAVDWYAEVFGFRVILSSPAFGAVERGHLRLLLSGRMSSAGRPMPDGRQPEPGGWNRFQVIVEDIAAEVERLRGRGLKFRNDVVSGPGGSQVLVEDPSGNVIEVFQPSAMAFQPVQAAR